MCRMLYWTDWSSRNPGIYRSSVDSPARETLVTDDLIWPNSLTIDFTGNYSNDAGNLLCICSIDCLG